MSVSETFTQDRMVYLSSIYHTGPVTALCCHGNSVLAGIGSRVHVYSLPHCELQHSTEVLPARIIHGIKQVFGARQPTQFCMYGQKCLRLVDFESTSLTISPQGELLEFSDWIWEVTCLQGDSSRQLSLALGHNVIVIYDVDRQCVINSVHCQEKCILYCARFLTSKPDCVILAAGTVFNQVVIWSAQSIQDSPGRVEPFHRLTGHQGVIFSVDYSPSTQTMCSVSDDRSIRLYQILFEHQTSDPSLLDWQKMDSSLLHVLYGHSARVWDVRLLSEYLVSIGEDSTCCLWSFDGRVLQRFKGHKGKSIWSMCVDKGENFVITGGGDNSIRLWHLQQQQFENKNCQTKSLELQLEKEDFPRNTMLLDAQRILAITNKGKLMLYNQVSDKCGCLMSDTSFGSYTVMAVSPCSTYIAIGNIHGTLRILHESASSGFESSGCILTDVKVCDGKLLSVVWLGEDKLVTTAPDGMINVWEIHQHDQAADLEVTFTFVLPPSKHRWVSAATLVQGGRNIIIGDRTGSLFLYSLAEQSKKGELVQTYPKIHGKAGVTFVCCHDNQIFSAGRDGIYRTFVWTETGKLDLLHNNRVCKGFEWIERLDFTDDDDIQIQGFYTNLFVIWSVKHNQKLLEIECGGGHRAWDYSCHGNKATFVYVKTREVKVTNVEMRSNQFIVKKCLHGRELCDAKLISSGTDSSGRSVTALVTCSEDTSLCLSFLYYKNGTPELDVRHCLSGHISTVRCLCVCSCEQAPVLAAENENPNLNRKLIFSGGGRAQLKVWCIEVGYPGGRQAQGTHRNKHDTLIIKQNASENTSSEANERSEPKEEKEICPQSHIRSGNIDHNCATYLDDSVNKQCSESCDSERDSNYSKYTLNYVCMAGLQLSNINRKCRKPWRRPVDNSDPETRILDLSVVTPEDIGHQGSRQLYFISAACSDGFLRLLAFDEVSREISLITANSYHDHCVLKTCHVIIPKSQVIGSCDNLHVTQSTQWPIKILVLSAATDGKVAFWDVTNICREFSVSNDFRGTDELKQKLNYHNQRQWDEKPVLALQLHQSGINSIYFGKYSDNAYILITGGDDNAVHVRIVTMDIEDTSKVKVIAEGCHINSHAAQITGTWFVEGDYVLTASIDQRICVWQLEWGDSKIQLRMCGCAFTSVSDVANIDVWREGDHHCLLISGNGLEVFKLQTSGKPVDTDQPVTAELPVRSVPAGVLTKIFS